MQRERLLFDLGTVYNDLRQEILKRKRSNSRFISKSEYYYLTDEDLFHDYFEKTLLYLNKNVEGKIDKNTFISIFWTTAKYLRLKNTQEKLKRTQEWKNFVSRDSIENDNFGTSKVFQPDIDREELVGKAKKFPTISKVLEGYSFAEMGRTGEFGERTYCKYYHNELKQLKKLIGLN